MLEGSTLSGKLLSLLVVVGLTAYFWTAYDGWWPYIWSVIAVFGLGREVQAGFRGHQKEEPELLYGSLDGEEGWKRETDADLDVSPRHHSPRQ